MFAFEAAVMAFLMNHVLHSCCDIVSDLIHLLCNSKHGRVTACMMYTCDQTACKMCFFHIWCLPAEENKDQHS